MLTATQKSAAEAILNIFETGEAKGDYGQVTLITGDTGHLTFGRSQTTLGSGGLYKLLQRYCDQPGARFAGRLGPYLPRLNAGDLALDNDAYLHNILRASADDIVMRDTQDLFFEEEYWKRAAAAAKAEGIVTPLGVTVVYDGFVQGSWGAMRDRTKSSAGGVTAAGEKTWIAAYVSVRRAWLAGSTRADLRATVYRMDVIQGLIDQGHWNLDLPLMVRDREISMATLSALPPRCYDGPQPGTRVLAVQTPLLRGLDVRLVQLGLSRIGVSIRADGIFGNTSSGHIRAYQSGHGMPVTGVADAALIAQFVA